MAGVLVAAVALGGLAVTPASAATPSAVDGVCAVPACVPGHEVSIDAPLEDVVGTLDDCDRTEHVEIDIHGYGTQRPSSYRPDQPQAAGASRTSAPTAPTAPSGAPTVHRGPVDGGAAGPRGGPR